MIEINLLPDELKKTKRAASKIELPSIEFEKLPFTKLAVIAIASIIAVQITIYAFGMLANNIYGMMDSRYKKIRPERIETEQLKTQVSKMSKKVSAIDELMVKRFSWAKKLNDLSDSLTAGIWLTQLKYDEKLVEKPRAVVASPAKGKQNPEANNRVEKVMDRYLIISGAASSMGEEGTALIGRFIQNLKDNNSFYSDFNDIELGSIKREQMAGQEIMTFKITCLFKTK